MGKILLYIVVLLCCISKSVASDLDCDQNSRTCTGDVYFFENSKVIWLLTAQTSLNPGFKIRYSDVNGQWVTLVDTTVLSEKFENMSTGDFQVPVRGLYRLVFTDVSGVKRKGVTFNEGQNGISIANHVFATEDGDDRDYNDAVAFVSCLVKTD